MMGVSPNGRVGGQSERESDLGAEIRYTVLLGVQNGTRDWVGNWRSWGAEATLSAPCRSQEVSAVAPCRIPWPGTLEGGAEVVLFVF